MVNTQVPQSDSVSYQDKMSQVRQKAVEDERACDMQYKKYRDITAISTAEDWKQVRLEALEEYDNGTTFIEQMGRRDILDPKTEATLLNLRQLWIEQEDVQSVPEMLLMDTALMSYQLFTRTNQQIGNIRALMDRELFGLDSVGFEMEKKLGRGSVSEPQLKAKKLLDELVEKKIPVMEHAHKMMLKSIKAIRDQKRSNVMLTIKQLNIAEKQVNVNKV